MHFRDADHKEKSALPLDGHSTINSLTQASARKGLGPSCCKALGPLFYPASLGVRVDCVSG